MSSKRFPKTMDKISELFPGHDLATDTNKALRHELYKYIHDIPLGNVPKQSRVEDFEFSQRDLTHKEWLALCEVNTVYADERAALQSLPEFVEQTVLNMVNATVSFSAFDVTDRVRQFVNSSALALLNDRPFEDVEIVEGSGVKGLTQKIPHSEVRAIVADLFTDGKLTGYEKVRTGKYFTYQPTSGCRTLSQPTYAAVMNPILAGVPTRPNSAMAAALQRAQNND